MMEKKQGKEKKKGTEVKLKKSEWRPLGRVCHIWHSRRHEKSQNLLSHVISFCPTQRDDLTLPFKMQCQCLFTQVKTGVRENQEILSKGFKLP